jgi:hypothetical protein
MIGASLLEGDMWKLLIVTTAALAIAGSSAGYAQQRDDDRDGGARFEHRHHKLSPEDRAAFADARIAALKAGLELTPDQAKNWPAFEQALHNMAQLRAQIRADREARKLSQTPSTPIERISRRADNLAKKSTALKLIADTGAPFYKSLDDAQKERFKKLAHFLRPHHRRLHAWNEGKPNPSDRRTGSSSRI